MADTLHPQWYCPKCDLYSPLNHKCISCGADQTTGKCYKSILEMSAVPEDWTCGQCHYRNLYQKYLISDTYQTTKQYEQKNDHCSHCGLEYYNTKGIINNDNTIRPPPLTVTKACDFCKKDQILPIKEIRCICETCQTKKVEEIEMEIKNQKNCQKCGTKCPDNAEYCPKCGTKIGAVGFMQRPELKEPPNFRKETKRVISETEKKKLDRFEITGFILHSWCANCEYVKINPYGMDHCLKYNGFRIGEAKEHLCDDYLLTHETRFCPACNISHWNRECPICHQKSPKR